MKGYGAFWSGLTGATCALCLSIGCGRTPLSIDSMEGGEGGSAAGRAGTTGTAGTFGTAGMAGNGGTAGGAGIGATGGQGGDSGGPPIKTETCDDPENEGRWDGGHTLYVEALRQCAGRSPCFGTLANAVDAAASGDTVLVLPGTHGGALVQQTAERASLRIRALEGPDSTTISGSCLRVIGRGGGSGQIWIEGFTFRDCGPAGAVDEGWGVFVSVEDGAGLDARFQDNVSVRIQDNVFAGGFGRGGVGLEASTNTARLHAVVTRNRILDHHGENAALDADLMADADEDYCIRFENNVVARSGTALSIAYRPFRDGAGKFLIANNTFAGNEAATDLSNRGAACTFVNNIVFGNAIDFAPTAEIASPHDVRHNLIGSGQFTGLNGNFAADPLFEDAAAGDFRLRGASPGIDRGDPRGAPRDDITGALRTEPFDVGAHERTAPAGEPLGGLRCGDGVVQSGPVTTSQGGFLGFEACDDGNQDSGDGCSSLCQLEAATPPPGHISLREPRLCAIRADKSLACWGEVQDPVPVGPFQQVALNGYGGCALREDGTASCWFRPYTFPEFVPSGRFTQISADREQTCGRREDGSITCWNSKATTLEQPGPFVRVDTNSRVCGLFPSGETSCFAPYPQFPPGPFVHIFPDDEGGCGLRRTGQLVCQPSTLNFVTSVPRAALVQLHIADNQACGIRPDGRAVFWSSGGGNALLLENQRFIETVPGPDFCCGLTRNHHVSCSKNVHGLPSE